jgi:hypothetical protein
MPATVEVVIPPAIITPPASFQTVAGSNATFSVNVAGTPMLYCQWLFNGLPLSNNQRISGTKELQLLINDTRTSDAGAYTVAISNIAGTVTSLPAAMLDVTAVTFTDSEVDTSGVFHFRIQGENGKVFEILTSPDLSNWQSFILVTNINLGTNLSDQTSSNLNQRFFKALER